MMQRVFVFVLAGLCLLLAVLGAPWSQTNPLWTFIFNAPSATVPAGSTDYLAITQGSAIKKMSAQTPTFQGVNLGTSAVAVRQPHGAARNLYVATTGTDGTNTCEDSGSPCLTLQYAVNQYLKNYDGKGYVTDIYVGNGTYAGFVCAGVPVGTATGVTTPAYLSIVGTNGSANVTISDTGSAAGAVMAINSCYIGVQGVKIQSTSGADIMTQYGGLVSVNSDVVLGAAGRGKLHSDASGTIKINNGYTSIGNAVAEVEAVLGGQVIYDETIMTVTLSGTPVYSTAFVSLQSGSIAYINSNFITFSGSATGTRFNLTGGAMLETIGGAVASYIPGSLAGTVSGGGYYSPGTLNIGTAPIVANNSTTAASANPTGTTNLVGNGVMMGGGGTITPRTSGTVLITFSGACANSVIADGGGVSIYVGTGAAPANGAALTGNAIGSQMVFTEAAAAAFMPCSGSAIAAGQAIGTAMWYQLALVARTGGTASLVQVSMTASEL